MNRFEKYSSYKDSGVEWLGKIPEHWEILSNKNIFKIKQKLVGKKSSEYDLLSLTLKGIIKRDMENPQGKFPAEFNTYQEVKKGDFVFCLFDVEETPRTVGLSSFDGMITGAYTVMTSENIDKGYLYYFYLNLDSSKRFKPLYRGLRNTIPKDSFFSFKTFIPPKEEQKKIASFLDEKTAQIDEVISQKEKLIELLKERKQIVINDAVTKGVAFGSGTLVPPSTSTKDGTKVPFPKMKDSGVEWIGEIPEHWEIKKLKFIVNNKTVKSIESDFKIALENIESKTTKYIETQEIVFSEAGINFNKGDILFGKLRPYLAKVYLAEKDGLCVSEFLVLESKQIYNLFLKYILVSYSCIDYINSSTYGTKMPRASWSFIGNSLIPIPPKEEQIKIVEYIENQTSKIDIAIELQQNYISKLKEYKASLIDSVVTGKVKVS